MRTAFRQVEEPAEDVRRAFRRFDGRVLVGKAEAFIALAARLAGFVLGLVANDLGDAGRQIVAYC
ncbi:hypothetical protein [Xanthobacter tagetidis]|uniref:hypothetical protein n=1 Tax=Xanthobacter tagetidis TaxID=60216 RepID=UPI0011C37CD3|nr:hypothetical protein [Xanthobacter tagetidis]MBB6306217.1 hypothetical protein [Xanthobacter tagetidis]